MWQSHSPSIQSVPSGSKLSVIIPGDQTHAPARIGYKDKGVRSWRHKDKALAKRVAAPGEQVVRVPQLLYTSPNNSDIRDKKPDILFNIPREGGIKLDAALNLGFDYPREWKTEYVKCFATTKRITIRINWPGYTAFGATISVCDDTATRPVTKAILAFKVAEAIQLMLTSYSSISQTSLEQEKWTIGSNFVLSSILITQLRQVAEESWQPELYIIRPPATCSIQTTDN